MTDRTAHWETVYTTKETTEVGWYQPEPKMSLELIKAASPSRARLIDVGGGASVLVDRLLDRDHGQVAVLDISAAALEKARARLAGRAGRVQWIVGDVTALGDVGQFDVWHDRAVFHFLTDSEDRRRFVELAAKSVPPGGHLVIGTFALDGPHRCSGLEVRRYDAESLSLEFGSVLRAVRHERETHVTPSGKPQPFVFVVLVRQ